MKKFLVAIFTLALIAALPFTALAATGINENEQAVLDLLETSVSIGVNNWHFEIPQSYVNTAKNYFAGDFDMTAAEKEAILACINSGIEVVKKDAQANATTAKEFHLSSLSDSARESVLSLGQRACAEVDLQLTYAPASNTVTITEKSSSTPVFNSTAVIKTTGQTVTVDAAFVATSVVVCLVLATGAMFIVSKKNGLWVK